MKPPIPLDFSRAEARVALAMLEWVIDALIELHARMRRAYDIHEDEEELPF